MPNIKVLVLKLAAVDGLASRAITLGDVTTLEDQWEPVSNVIWRAENEKLHSSLCEIQ